MKISRLLLALTPCLLSAQGLDPSTLALFKQPTGVWPTYNGDYSGRRFSDLTQITQANVDMLKIDWIYRINSVGAQRGVGAPSIKSTPLLVDGILYFTIPDHVFAISARTGEQLWQYDFEDKGGHLVGQRGVAMYGNWLYFLTPDGWFISLNSKDGKERWRKKVADEKLQYFTTIAPLIVKNHVIVGVGGDAMDVRGYLESRDPETGDVQWKWWRRDGSWRRNDVASWHLRPRSQPSLLGYRQRQSGFCRTGAPRIQPLHGFDCGAQRRYRQTRVVLPGVSPRYARLG
jgi:alcohol dehydrogenase (cytochrome c)